MFLYLVLAQYALNVGLVSLDEVKDWLDEIFDDVFCLTSLILFPGALRIGIHIVFEYFLDAESSEGFLLLDGLVGGGVIILFAGCKLEVFLLFHTLPMEQVIVVGEGALPRVRRLLLLLQLFTEPELVLDQVLSQHKLLVNCGQQEQLPG